MTGSTDKVLRAGMHRGLVAVANYAMLTVLVCFKLAGAGPVRWLVYALTCAATLSALVNLLPGGRTLRIAKDGIVVTHLYRGRPFGWNRIGDFAVVRVWGQDRVGLRLAPDGGATAPHHAALLRVAGVHEILPDNYRMTAPALASMLNAELDSRRASPRVADAGGRIGPARGLGATPGLRPIMIAILASLATFTVLYVLLTR